ncbi:MAG: hypothetical protein QMC77_07970 [Methanocellales archaeon]|nr:hypothetical protein [Methanocellales archaeon]
MGVGLEYMERLSEQKERLKKQEERVKAQKTRGGGIKVRRQTEEGRIKAQRERILRQKRLEIERAEAARLRGEAVTGIDALEREKLSRQSIWRGKWDRRRARWEARAREFERR